MKIKEALILEEQAAFFVELAQSDDLETMALGRFKDVDLWATEQICVYGIAKIYGLDG